MNEFKSHQSDGNKPEYVNQFSNAKTVNMSKRKSDTINLATLRDAIIFHMIPIWNLCRNL